MSDNLKLWEQVRAVPSEAKKPIKGGRISGATDINPMWRIKILTEMFGKCGEGWKYEVLDKQIVDAFDGQKACFVDIMLYYRTETGEWSEGVFGTGGNMFVVKESRGLYINDECYKMSLTDAISVSAKALGIGADVYFEKDKTKYSQREEENQKSKPKEENQASKDLRREINNMLMKMANNDPKKAGEMLALYTTFTNKDGKEIKGKSDPSKLSEKALQPTYGKIKAEYLAFTGGTK